LVCNNGLNPKSVFAETVTIYDNAVNPYSGNAIAHIPSTISSPYMSSIYGNTNITNMGNALTLVATDNSSNTFLNISTISGKNGMRLGGGAFAGNANCSASSIELQDSCGNFRPLQMMVSGSDTIINPGTLGINTYYPNTDLYSLDINGQTLIHNTQIIPVLTTSKTIQTIRFSRLNPLSGICVVFSDSSFNTFLYTINGGKTWHNSMRIPTTLKLTKFYDLFIYDNYHAVCLVMNINSNYIQLYTYNGGITWVVLSAPNANVVSSFNTTSVFFMNDVIYFGITHTNSSNAIIYYINIYNTTTWFPLINVKYTIEDTGNQKYVRDFSGNITQIIGDKIQFSVDYYLIIVGESPVGNTNCELWHIIDSTTYIPKYSTSSALSFNSNNDTVYISGIAIYNDFAVFVDYTKKSIYMGQFIVTLRNNDISISFTYGTPKGMQSINAWYIYDENTAIIVGNNGEISTTINKGVNLVGFNSKDNINSVSISKLILNPNVNLNTVYIPNLSSFVISTSSVDNSGNVYYCNIPDIFNSINNNILDIYGNQNTYGDISSNHNLYIGGDSFLSNRVFIGGDVSINANSWTTGSAAIGGDVSMNSRLFVGGDVSFNASSWIVGNLAVGRDVSMNSRLFIGGDASFNASSWIVGNLAVGRDVSMNSRLFVGGDASFNANSWTVGNLAVGRDASFNRYVAVGGNLFVNGDTILRGNLIARNNTRLEQPVVMLKDVAINGNLDIRTKLGVFSDTSLNGQLLVYGPTTLYGAFVLNTDASLNGNIAILNDSTLSGNLTVNKNAGFNGNTTVNGNIAMNGAVTIQNKSVFLTDISVNNRLFVGTDASINGNLFVNGNFKLMGQIVLQNDFIVSGNLVGTNLKSSNNTYISSSAFIGADISCNGNVIVGRNITGQGNITVSTANNINNGLITTNIYPTTNILNLATVQNLLPQTITLGSSATLDTITIVGNLVVRGTQQNVGAIINVSPTIQLLGTSTLGQSAHAGIQIGENGLSNAGYMLISSDLNGFIFQPTYGAQSGMPSNTTSNILKINVNGMVLGPTINTGIVTLAKTTGTGIDSNYTMNVGTIDVSNILLKNVIMDTQTINSNITISGNTTFNVATNSTSSTTGAIVVTGGMGITGNVFIQNGLSITSSVAATTNGTGALQIPNGGAYVGGNTYIGGVLHLDKSIIINKTAVATIANTNLDINGNAIISSIGIGTSSVNPNYVVDILGNANINGNVNMNASSYILQF